MAFTTVTGASGAPTTYTGTDGVDLITLVNPGASDLTGFEGNDVINISFTAATTTATGISARGGQGDDTFAYTGGFANALVTSFLAGNAGDDAFGAAGAGLALTQSTLQGGQGNDVITVGASNGGGFVNGNLGNDQIIATQAVAISSTSLLGGQGNDTFTIDAGTLNGVVIDGALGNDTITIGATTALAAGTANVTVSGGDGIDTINAAGAGRALWADGGAGNDVVTTGTGNDTIVGGDGVDILTAGAGNDSVSGGAGNDRFVLGASTALTATVQTVIAVGSVITFGNGVDIIADAVTGDTFDATTAGATTSLIGVDIDTDPGAAAFYSVRGSWSGTKFTVSATGADMLTVDFDSATAINDANDWTVLLGYGNVNGAAQAVTGGDTNVIAAGIVI